MFLNYGWAEADVAASLETARQMGEREAAVFVGVDVFGRGQRLRQALRRLLLDELWRWCRARSARLLEVVATTSDQIS